MSKSFTHPQPHWLPLHELPFVFPDPYVASANGDQFEEFLVAIGHSRWDLLKDYSRRIAKKYQIKSSMRFFGMDCEKKGFRIRV